VAVLAIMTEDMENGFLHVAVSTPPVRLPDVAVADPRCVKLPEEQLAINFISYDTKARCVTLRLSLARFNSSTCVVAHRVAGRLRRCIIHFMPPLHIRICNGGIK